MIAILAMEIIKKLLKKTFFKGEGTLLYVLVHLGPHTDYKGRKAAL
jgi:hypothetical protein